ncbi:MAG: hypothetical protein JXB38_03920 [Anaerolineales bacterium]|nr:hypothetical protein [Anaerolineales bacterium]
MTAVLPAIIGILIVAMMLALVGCSPATIAEPSGEKTPLPPTGTLPSPTQSPEGAVPLTPSSKTPADARLQDLVDKAAADLAKRLAVTVDQINLLEAASVVWPDASLGCPEEGMAYAQVLTPGYLIRLEAGGQEYEYHASRAAPLLYCENPQPPVPGAPPDV